MTPCCSLLFIALSFSWSGAAQEDQDNYFTGTLVDTAADHLTVSRVLQGKAEERVFQVNAQTKIEGGRLRPRGRVTVRYISGDDSDTAILVIVRRGPRPPKNRE